MPRPPAKCGTDGGYYRHKRTTHTDPCQPCRDAHAKAREVRDKGRHQAKKKNVPCRGCGVMTYRGRCRGCAKQAAAEEALTNASLAYTGEWAVVNGILRPVRVGTWRRVDGEIRSTRRAA